MPSLMRYINITSRCGVVWRSDKLKGEEIGAAHTGYILIICRNPGISQEQLSKRIFINKSNVTRNLSYLEAHGYVERRQSETDKRVIEVYPTEKAIEILPKIQELNREWNKYLTDDLSDEEIETFMSLLTKIASRAAEYGNMSLNNEEGEGS